MARGEETGGIVLRLGAFWLTFSLFVSQGRGVKKKSAPLKRERKPKGPKTQDARARALEKKGAGVVPW